jgi:ATP-dependent Lon protease
MRCEVEWIEDVDVPSDGPEVQRLIAQHMRLLELAGRTVRPEFYQTDGLLSYRLARNAGLELAQKQTLLEAASERERVIQLVGHLKDFIPKVERFETVRQKVRSNGHFSDFPPEI